MDINSMLSLSMEGGAMDQREECGMRIKRIDTLLSTQANESLGRIGITLSQARLLNVLLDSPGQEAPFKHIEHALRVSQPTTVGLIARLRDKGMVETFDSPLSQNAKVARLTEAGRSACERGRLDMELANARILAGFSPEEREGLIAMLDRIIVNLEREP